MRSTPGSPSLEISPTTTDTPGLIGVLARLSAGAVAISLAFGAAMSAMLCLWPS
jgi:hypothetical protein